MRLPGRRSPFVWPVVGLSLLVAVPLGVACSNETDRSGPVESALHQTLVQVRSTQGQPWGTTLPGLAAAAIAGPESLDRVPRAVSGSSDPPGNDELTLADRFHVGSVTKTFTAALIMQLDQSGDLSLSDPVSNWIRYPGGRNITVEMLLGHTSGIPDFSELPGRQRTDTPERSIGLASSAQPLFPPGSQWSYSNTNYIMLGVIAERVTGVPWADQVRTRFFEPLALADTYVWDGEARQPTVHGSRLDCGYPGEPKCVKRPGFEIVPVTDGFDWTAAWAAGAIVSTPSDLARWIDQLVGGEVLDAEHRRLLTSPTPQSVKALAGSPSYGAVRWTGGSLGLLRYEIDGEGTGWGHEGSINGFVSNVVRMDESDQTVAVTSNFLQTDGFAALGELVVATGEAAET